MVVTALISLLMCVFFYQQVYFNLFTYGFVPDIMKINKSCWNRQFFENEFISIAKTMGFEGYSET